MVKKFVIFDLDGTLIDSVPDLAKEISLFLEKNGRRKISVSETASVIGNGAAMMLKGAFKLTGTPLSDSELADLLPKWVKQYAEAPMDLTYAYPHVAETLQKLRQDGCSLAICTNKPAAPTKAILNQLDLRKYFDVVLDADALPVRKPRPEPLWEAIKRMNGTPDSAVMVGDSEADAQAARAAGLPVVLLTYGYTHVPFDEIKPDAQLDDFADLPATLKKL